MKFKINQMNPVQGMTAVFYDEVGQPYAHRVQCIALVEFTDGSTRMVPVVFRNGSTEAEPLGVAGPENDLLGVFEGDFNPRDWLLRSGRQRELAEKEEERCRKANEAVWQVVRGFGDTGRAFKFSDIVQALAKTQTKVSQKDVESACSTFLAAGLIGCQGVPTVEGPFVVVKK